MNIPETKDYLVRARRTISRMNKGFNQCSDLICSRVQREMTGVKDVNLSIRHIFVVSLRLPEIE